MLKLGLLLAATVGLFTSPFGPTMRQPAELTAPFTMGACGSCQWCIGGHKAPEGGGDISSLHSWCMELADCNGHPGCNVTLGSPTEDVLANPLLDTIEDAIHGNSSALVALARNPAVRWNESRGALQVEGTCDESVVAHIPVRRAIAEELGLPTASRADN